MNTEPASTPTDLDTVAVTITLDIETLLDEDPGTTRALLGEMAYRTALVKLGAQGQASKALRP